MSTFTAKLPFEVVDLIIDYLATQDDKSFSSVKACSLVSRSLLPRARTHIFSSIIHIEWPPTSRWTLFARLISHTPAIADYVTSLHCHIDDSNLDELKESNIEHLVRALTSLTSLKNLSLSFYDEISWKDLKIIKEPLLNLMHLPTLRSLMLHRPYEFPLSDLTRCVDLKHLETEYYMDPNFVVHTEVDESVEIYQEEPSRLESFDGGAPTIIVLCAARRTDGRPIVDVTGLRKLCLRITCWTDVDGMWELFRHLHQLTSVEISDYDRLYNELDDGSLYDPPHLFLPSLHTLQHVHLVINHDPTRMLVAGFTSITGKNIIESIKLSVTLRTRGFGPIDYDDNWSTLDQVFTRSGLQFGWEKLRLFSLQVTVHFEEEVDNKSMEQLRMLLVTGLKGLASSNTIVLDLKVLPFRPRWWY